jgi:hypothetical protein
MTVRSPFQPKYGSNVAATATTTAASHAIDPTNKTVFVVNSGTNVAYFRIGRGAQTATNKDCPIRSNWTMFVEKPDGADTISYISKTGTTTLDIMTGEGGTGST